MPMPAPASTKLSTAKPAGEEPIAALATASGLGGVAIIRLSGSGVYAIADKLTRLSPPPSARPAGTFAYAKVLGGRGETLDDAVLLFYRAPHSYTGEDVIELCVHGGQTVPQAVLERLLELGARPAEPGEFTKRAFLNGRLDLTQAEAVADLIAARTPRAEKAARANLEGRLGQSLSPLYDEALACSAEVEHALDFEEDELPADFFPRLSERLDALTSRAERLLATWHEGRLLRDGARVVIAGKPNVGKSSLLNLLLGTSRAIVSHEPGTTRDVIEEVFQLDGYPLRLTDTAGLREAPGAVEREGVARARQLLDQADLVLYLVASDDPDDTPPPGALVVRTKADLAPNASFAEPTISVTQNPEGARETVCALLRERLRLCAGETPHATLATARQFSELSTAKTSFLQAAQLFRRGGWDAVPAAQCLRTGAEALGRILGRVYSADLLDSIFSSFCVGK